MRKNIDIKNIQIFIRNNIVNQLKTSVKHETFIINK